MSNSSSNSVVVIALAMILILLLAVGGAGIFFFMARQQMVEAQARARAAEELNRINDAIRAHNAREAAAGRATSSAAAEPQSDDAIRAAVESVLRIQEEAWNRGDVDSFMDHYWKSDELTFSSRGKITRGWDATLAGYRERYPTREKMGRVGFSDLEITPLGDSAALVLGRWTLDREEEPLSGNFTIVMRKQGGRWLITHDHTSRLMPSSN